MIFSFIGYFLILLFGVVSFTQLNFSAKNTLSSFFLHQRSQNVGLLLKLIFALLTLFAVFIYQAVYWSYLLTPVIVSDEILTDLVVNLYPKQVLSPYLIKFAFPFMYIFILVTSLTLLFCFAYNTTELKAFSVYVFLIFLAGFGLFETNSLFLFFMFYESLLIPSFLILYSFAKTRKAVEAAFLMFFWTQFGALFLIFNFQYLSLISGSFYIADVATTTFSELEINFLFWTLVIGFGVKFPIWPFYEWLPKAHVEASTNFSIFLSGVLVKFAFFGFVRCLDILGQEALTNLLIPFLLIGLLDASTKVYFQIDLKKLVAYATVIEMHWLLLALVSGQSVLWIAAFAMLISHALLSSNFFFMVDAITRRFGTRLITEISGIFYLTPSLYFITLTLLIIFLGFPGTLFFIAEFMFFSFFMDWNFTIALVFAFLLYLVVPSLFFKNWFLVLFGNSFYFSNIKAIPDLDLKEKVLFSFFLLLITWLGLSFQFFF